jgi:hypothetical protein
MKTKALLVSSVTNIPIALDFPTFIMVLVQQRWENGTSWIMLSIAVTVSCLAAILPTNAG